MSHSAEAGTAYRQAIDQLYALGQELAPPPPRPDGTPAPRRKWDLAHMHTLCAAMGDPQNSVPSVLIAGTNGKGSTAATLASILSSAGYKTGLYTSPHLTRVNERIQILPAANSPQSLSSFAAGGPASPHAAQTHLASKMRDVSASRATATEIPDDAFARLYFQVDDTATRLIREGALPHHPSFFEVLTAVAFLYFAEERLDIAILEVGLGGRLDATNIVDPLISVITDIALDHQEYLGNTIAEITREKAGILRANGTLVTLPQHPEANQAIGEAAALLNLTAISAADFIPPQTPSHKTETVTRGHTNQAVILSEAKDPERLDPTKITQPFQPQVPVPCHPSTNSEDLLAAATALPHNHYIVTLNDEPVAVESPLSGHHQQRNIALAIATANALRNFESYKLRVSNHDGYKITNSAMESGIRNTHWPGRLEFLPPNLLLDVAHNPAGAWILRAAIARLPEDQPRTLIFSCLADKDVTEISRILFPLFDSSPNEGRERDHIIFAPITNPRAAQVEDLLAAAHSLNIPAHAAPHIAGALAQAQAITPTGGLIIATGSVYLVGAIRELAFSESAEGSAEDAKA